MYSQYIAGDLLYSRIYASDPPPAAAVSGIVTPEVAQASLQAAPAAVEPVKAPSPVEQTQKNAGLTGISGGLELSGLLENKLVLLLLLLLLLGRREG